MRFTKKLCALVSSLAVTASGQAVIQTPAPATSPANASDDAQVRDALRRTLDSGAGTSNPATPVTPLNPVTPVAPTIITSAPPVVPLVPYSYSITNAGGTNITTMALSLEQAI